MKNKYRDKRILTNETMNKPEICHFEGTGLNSEIINYYP